MTKGRRKMPILSSSSLFHFTKSLDNLIGILSSGFRFSTVREPYPQMAWGNSIFTSLGIQGTFTDNNVVCFCDIPLTQTSNHREQYGSYAIGLSKEWAIKNCVSPVRYVHSNSPGFSGKIMEFLDIYLNQRENQSQFVRAYMNHKHNFDVDLDSFDPASRRVIDALERCLVDALEYIFSGSSFYKAYELDDPIQRTPTRRYYDEREWRASSEVSNREYLTFCWADIDIVLCATRADCEKLYKRRREFSEHLKLRPMAKMWQKLISFDDIDANF